MSKLVFIAVGLIAATLAIFVIFGPLGFQIVQDKSTESGLASSIISLGSTQATGSALVGVGPSSDLYLYTWQSGAFTPEQHIGTGWDFTHFIVADFNKDGFSDIVVRDHLGNLRLYMWLGSGWSATALIGTDWNFIEYNVGDFNGDGYPDLLVKDADLNLWLYGWNGATWNSPIQVGTGWRFTQTFVADFNQDGRPDLLPRDSSGNLYLYYWTGSGFSGGNRVGVGWNFADIVLGDFNGDGKPDLLTRDLQGNLHIYTWSGSGWGDGSISGVGWGDYTDLIAYDIYGSGRSQVLARNSAGNFTIWQWTGSSWQKNSLNTSQWQSKYFFPGQFGHAGGQLIFSAAVYTYSPWVRSFDLNLAYKLSESPKPLSDTIENYWLNMFLNSKDGTGHYDSDYLGNGENHVLWSLLRMYQATGNTKYILKMINHIETVFNAESPLSWSSTHYSSSRAAWMVHQFDFLQPVALLIEEIKKDPGLKRAFGAKANTFANQILGVVSLIENGTTWFGQLPYVYVDTTAGAYYKYPSNFARSDLAAQVSPFNQQNVMAGTLASMGTSLHRPDLTAKAARLYEFFRNNIYTDSNGAYVWRYGRIGPDCNPTQPSCTAEDSSHAVVNVMTIFDGIKRNLIFNQARLNGLRSTLANNLLLTDNGNPVVSISISGSPKTDANGNYYTSDVFGRNWIFLSNGGCKGSTVQTYAKTWNYSVGTSWLVPQANTALLCNGKIPWQL